MTQGGVDYGDIQGLVRFGFKRMTEASYALAQVKNTEAARAWLRSAQVASAVVLDPPPTSAVQVAFTAAGLEALGTPAAVMKGFSPEFLAGMTKEDRSRRLGDVGMSAPSGWDWGGPSAIPHVLVMFFAEPGGLAALIQRATGDAWDRGFDLVRMLPTGNLGGVEPFGFADGISEPEIDWQQRRDLSKTVVDYDNLLALGEILLGYSNEYHKYTDRPLVDRDASSAGLFPAEDAPERNDLGRNGTYLVMRQLRQDVRGFWQFVYKEMPGDRAQADTLASLFVGRTRTGEPLVATDDPAKNRFTFEGDPAGVQCPHGAHIRRANPRNADFPGRPGVVGRLLTALGLRHLEFQDDLISSVRFHRILRRGREYGPWLSQADALEPAPADDPERGLHFICLNANIGRQFEFLQNAWMMSTKFSGMTGESDPLIGNHVPVPGCPSSDSFRAPRSSGLPRRVCGLPDFVTVRGGAYFFLPSLRALRYLARS